MEATRRVYTTRKMVCTSLLSAMAAVLMYIDTALPIFPAFLKLDISDLPALIGTFTFGPGTGVMVEAIKNVIHSISTSTGGVGELANFIMGSALVIPAGIIYRRERTKRGAMKGLATGTVSMAITAALTNAFMLLPFYSNFIPLDRIIELSSSIIPLITDVPSLVIWGVVPFNILKGTIVSFLTFLLYKRIGEALPCREV
nr:ECF transporter S component [uncultured Dethiosulfovibrio sp.]